MPFAVRISDLLHIPGRGTVLTGSVEAGTVYVGDRVRVCTPTESSDARLDGIEISGKQHARAAAGEQAAFLLHDFDPARLPAGIQRDDAGHYQVTDLVMRSPAQRWWQFWRA